MAKSPSLFDTLLTSITQSPRHFLGFVAGLGALFFSWIAFIIGLAVLATLLLSRAAWPWRLGVFVTGMVMVLFAWVVSAVSPFAFHALSLTAADAVLHGDVVLAHEWIFLVLVGVLFGLVIGGLFSLIALIPLGLRGEMQRIGRGKTKATAPGLSRAKLDSALAKLERAATPTGSTLGVDRQHGRPVELRDVDANLHTAIFGTTGTGKTTTVMNILESQLIKRVPSFYVDGKGDRALADKVQAYCARHQIPFYLFSMVGESCCYNPLDSGGYTSKKDRIVELRGWSEPHYKVLAEGYLQTVMKVLSETGQAIDLSTVGRYLHPDALFELVRDARREDLRDEVARLEGRQKDISSLLGTVENLVDSELGHLFQCAGQSQVLTLAKAFEEKAMVYFCLQPLLFPSYAETLGRLVVNDLKALAASQLSQAHVTPFYVFLDEFYVFAGPQVITLLNQGRSAGAHVVLSTQAPTDVISKGDQALLGQVITNCNNYIIQRQNNPADAELLAGIIGTQAGFEVSSQLSAETGASGLGNVKETQSYIIHPDDIKRLELGEAILLHKRQHHMTRVLCRKGQI